MDGKDRIVVDLEKENQLMRVRLTAYAEVEQEESARIREMASSSLTKPRNYEQVTSNAPPPGVSILSAYRERDSAGLGNRNISLGLGLGLSGGGGGGAGYYTSEMGTLAPAQQQQQQQQQLPTALQTTVSSKSTVQNKN